jgi:signal transduction histidine kinase
VATVRNITQEAQQGLDMLPAHWLFGESVPHTILDLQGDGVPQGLRLEGMKACVTTAVHRAGAPVAAIGIFWREAPALSVESLALFRALVDQLAILAENARLRRLQNESLVREERSRLARELHDSVTQALYALALRAETTANAVRQGRVEQLDERLDRIAASARQALREMRLLLYELRLSASERLHVAEALRLRLDAVEGRAGIAAHLEIDPSLSLPLEHEAELYWIAMEALNNTLKHAAANRVTVALRRCGGGYELAIEDDGVGLSADAGSRGGLGLRSMQERAERLGGVLAVGPSALGGTGVRLFVANAGAARSPVPQGAEDAGETIERLLEREANA